MKCKDKVSAATWVRIQLGDDRIVEGNVIIDELLKPVDSLQAGIDLYDRLTKVIAGEV